MKLDLKIVSPDFEGIKNMMELLLNEFKEGQVESNCYLEEREGEADYSFTNSDDIFNDDPQNDVVFHPIEHNIYIFRHNDDGNHVVRTPARNADNAVSNFLDNLGWSGPLPVADPSFGIHRFVFHKECDMNQSVYFNAKDKEEAASLFISELGWNGPLILREKVA